MEPTQAHLIAAEHLTLALFSGKGGVGKTTLACGWARRWAQQFPEQRILLVSTDPAHSLADVLQASVSATATPIADLPNLHVRNLDAQALFQAFKAEYGPVLELLAERGSFLRREDLAQVWDLSLPGLDELMSLLEIQRLLRHSECDRIVVDMAPSGHTLNLLKLMDFLDQLLLALDLFQENHRTIQRSFTGYATADAADEFLHSLRADLTAGRQLLQDPQRTGCIVVAIAEPMSLLETGRLIQALGELQIPVAGLGLNRILHSSRGEALSPALGDRLAEQHTLLSKFHFLAQDLPLWTVPQQPQEPVGAANLDAMMQGIQSVYRLDDATIQPLQWQPQPLSPGMADFIAEGRKLVVVGGKGGVGKTTVAGAIALGLAQRHPEHCIQVISIDPAHSLGDAFGFPIGHLPQPILPNLSGQEIDTQWLLDQFRQDYLWELAEMISGENGNAQDAAITVQLAYAPQGWRKIVDQAIPGIDELLALLQVMEQLETNAQSLIVLDTAPTGHLLRFLEMPTTLADWLAWIFKLWIQYQSVMGKTEFMGRLRSLRQRVVQAQKRLKDPQHTEFIGVVQSRSAILAEAQRLAQTLAGLGVQQRYIVQNQIGDPAIETDVTAIAPLFPGQAIVQLPHLPRCVEPMQRLQMAAALLCEQSSPISA
jgi:arsenite/tail-anchored protein-transporting ATPase